MPCQLFYFKQLNNYFRFSRNSAQNIGDYGVLYSFFDRVKRLQISEG